MTGLRQASGHAVPVVDGVDERLVAYAFAVEAIFAELRAIIGQLSGTLILLQDAMHLGSRRIAGTRSRPARPAVERIDRLNSPEGRLADRGKLAQAVDHIDAAIVAMRACATTVPRTDRERVGAAAAAYRLMQDVCDHRIGLTMVDIGNACCACGKKLA